MGKMSVKDWLFCSEILDIMRSKNQHRIMSPFYTPVDARIIPSYYIRIQEPMDIAKMKV